MSILLDQFRFLLVTVAGWMNQHQLLVIDCLHLGGVKPLVQELKAHSPSGEGFS